MADLALRFNSATRRYDLAVDAAGNPAQDQGLRTAVIAAVLSWGRAREGDPLPGFDGDRKGHWADSWAPGGRKGSRVWLLHGRVITPRTVEDAKTYLEEALSGLVKSGRAQAVLVQTARQGTTGIAGIAKLILPDGSDEVVEFDTLNSA